MEWHSILDDFDRIVLNDSVCYNCYDWKANHRSAAAANIAVETRPLPRPSGEIDRTSSVVFVPPVGGMLMFSGNHPHSSVPNRSGRTRISIDFRTVHVGDVRAGLGAPNVDSACTSSSIRDFKRASDFADMPDDVVELFNDGTEAAGMLVFDADAST